MGALFTCACAQYKYVSEILKIDRKTVRRGRKEVLGIIESVSNSRQRKVGGGRKKKLRTVANLGKI